MCFTDVNFQVLGAPKRLLPGRDTKTKPEISDEQLI